MGFRLTDRDIQIIRQVERFRLLRSRDHIVPLFGGSKHVLRRLQKLHENRYLYRLPDRDPYEQGVYAIGNAGADLLNTEFDLPRPKVDYTQQNKGLGSWFVEHTLLIADIMTAIIMACRNSEDVRYISQEEILHERAPEATRKQRHQVGGRPFRWRVTFNYDGKSYEKSIEPDHMFGLVLPDGRDEFFFLEADRQNMPVKSNDMDRSSIFKKQLQYRESWKTYAEDAPNLYEKQFGIRHIRTLFAISTGYHGDKRLNRCIEVNKYFGGGSGTGLFLFANVETLLKAHDASEEILTAPLISGRKDQKMLMA
jgi:hypothetical protein